MERNTKARIIFSAALALTGFLAYFSALSAPFVFDDNIYILRNTWIRSLANFSDTTGMRYVGDLSFALNYRVSGLDPLPFHLVNVGIHIINSLLVFAFITIMLETPLLKGLFGRDGARIRFCIASLTSMTFLLHPLNTQAVTYLSQRYTSLAALFYLAAAASYMKARSLMAEERRGFRPALFYLGSVVSTVLAMKTKEFSFTIPFVIAFLEAAFFYRKGGGVLHLVPFALALLIIPLGLMAEDITAGNRADEYMRLKKLEDMATMSPYTYLITQSLVVMTYIRLVFLPVNQHFDYNFPLAGSFFEPGVIASCAVLGAAAVVSIYCLARSVKRREGYAFLIAFGAAWFFVTLSIESSVIPIKDVIFEHRVYLPGIGLFLSSFSLLFYLREAVEKRFALSLRPALLAALAAFLVLPPLALATVSRNLVWSDELRLYSDEVRKNHDEAGPHIYLGLVYADRGRIEDALFEFRRAVELKPDSITGRNNLAHALRKLGRLDEAIVEFRELSRLKPSGIHARYYTSAHLNLGALYIEKGQYGKAEKEFEEALRLDPESEGAIKALGYLRSGKAEKIVVR